MVKSDCGDGGLVRGQHIELRAGQGIPKNDLAVVAGGGEDAAIGRIIDGPDPVGMAGVLVDELAVGQAPDANVVVVARCRQPLPAAMHANGGDHWRFVVVIVGRQLHDPRWPAYDAAFPRTSRSLNRPRACVLIAGRSAQASC